MNLQEAERRYAELKHRFEAGIIDAEDFNAERQRLMVQDDEGRWWARSPNNDEWNYYDGNAWLPGTPPGYLESIPEPTSSSALTPSPPHPMDAENRENGHQRVSPWIPVAGLGLTLVGIWFIVLVLVPYLRDESAPSSQSESMGGEQSDPMESQQEEVVSDRVAFDSAFVHSATSENISGNSTYLDNPLINGKPNALLYITHNWNPGGSGSIYNDHPVGVWYDTKRQRWAIYNQDKAPMPDGAAFNVIAILEEPTEAS